MQTSVVAQSNSRFFYGWVIVSASAFGMLTAPGSFAFYSLGVLIEPLTTMHGWTKAEISLGITYFTVASFAGVLCFAPLMDRFGPKRVLLFSQIGFGFSMMLPAFIDSLDGFHWAYALVGLLSAAANAPSYLHLISAWFVRRRGLAIGIASAAFGLSFTIVPGLTTLLLSLGGTRAAYLGLGALILLVSVPVTALFMRDRPADLGLHPDGVPPVVDAADTTVAEVAPDTGVSFQSAVRTFPFWLILAICFLANGSVYAIALHLPSIARTTGMTSASAVLVATLFGVAMIVGRIAGGMLFDRLAANRVTAGIVAVAAVGTIILASGSPGPALILGACLVGFCSGAENDALGILVGKCFGLAAYGKICSSGFAAALVGYATLPVMLGYAADHFQNYSIALMLLSALLLVAAVLSLMIRTRQARGEESQPNTFRATVDRPVKPARRIV